MQISDEVLGRLLFKSRHEPRRNQKRFLRDHGGDGSADELDRVLGIANESEAAKKECARLERQRELISKSVDAGVDGRVAEMLADIRVRMEERGMTQSELADLCGWQQSLVSSYLAAKTEPGIRNLAKMADALELVWRLTRTEDG